MNLFSQLKLKDFISQLKLKDFIGIFNNFRSSKNINDLKKIILYLQTAVGEANDEEVFIQKLVLSVKQTFYAYHGEEIAAFINVQ